jgi:hypothetical protein
MTVRVTRNVATRTRSTAELAVVMPATLRRLPKRAKSTLGACVLSPCDDMTASAPLCSFAALGQGRRVCSRRLSAASTLMAAFAEVDDRGLDAKASPLTSLSISCGERPRPSVRPQAAEPRYTVIPSCGGGR